MNYARARTNTARANIVESPATMNAATAHSLRNPARSQRGGRFRHSRKPNHAQPAATPRYAAKNVSSEPVTVHQVAQNAHSAPAGRPVAWTTHRPSRGYYTIVDSYGSFGGQEARLLGRCLAAETQREPSVQVRRETESLERLRVEECVDGFDTVAAQFEHLECPRDVATVGVPAVLGERGAAVGVAAQKP